VNLPEKCPNCGEDYLEGFPGQWIEYKCGSSQWADSGLAISEFCRGLTESRALRADKERLDWLDNQGCDMWYKISTTGPNARKAIDKAMG